MIYKLQLRGKVLTSAPIALDETAHALKEKFAATVMCGADRIVLSSLVLHDATAISGFATMSFLREMPYESVYFTCEITEQPTEEAKEDLDRYVHDYNNRKLAEQYMHRDFVSSLSSGAVEEFVRHDLLQ